MRSMLVRISAYNSNVLDKEAKENDENKDDSIRCQLNSPLTDKYMDSTIAAEALKWISDVERFYNSPSQMASKLTGNNAKITTNCQECQTDVGLNRSDTYSPIFSSIVQVLAKCLVKPMDTYNLPSETGRFIREVNNAPSRNNYDLEELKSLLLFIERDLLRLIKYLDLNSSSSKNMKDQLESMKSENNQLSKELSDAQNEYNNLNEKLSKELNELNKNYKKAQKENSKFKTNLEDLNKALTVKDTRIQELENQCQALENNLDQIERLFNTDVDQLNDDNLPSKSPPSSSLSKVQSCILELQRKLESTTKDYQSALKKLEVKEMENQNMNSQFTMLTKKHEKLLSRINELTEINEKLEEQLKDKNNSMEHLNSEINKYKSKIQELEKSIQEIKNKSTENESVKSQIQMNLEQVKLENNELCQKLNKLNEDLLQMAQYPDLNGPIVFENENCVKSVHEELEGQIQANELRITLLTEQTKRLRNALLVMNEKHDANIHTTHVIKQEDTELLSPKIDHLTLNNITPSISRSNSSILSIDKISTENQSTKEDASCIRSKTYTKSKILSNGSVENHSNIQLWSGPSTTTKVLSSTNSKAGMTRLAVRV
ncbi:unnamed protein product [Trichobilharzia szidati]|nr:unnamed protein product [Trichobilharzia szidati]